MPRKKTSQPPSSEDARAVLVDPVGPAVPRYVHVLYGGPSGTVQSSDQGEPLELKQGLVTRMTEEHLKQLRGVLPDHVFTEVGEPEDPATLHVHGQIDVGELEE